MIIKIIVLGIIQGLTEFLPVSSSGHLVLAQHFIGVKEPGIFLESALHMGTLVAVIIYFFQDIKKIIRRSFSLNRQRNLNISEIHWSYILISTLMTILIAFILGNLMIIAYDYVLLVILLLIINGLVLILAEKIAKTKRIGKKVEKDSAALIGIAQAISILPGISRSGATISTGLFLGVKGTKAARFSFIISIPAIILGNIYVLVKEGSNYHYPWSYYIIGIVVSAVVGVIAISIVMTVIKIRRFFWFGIYCFLIGSLSIVLYFWGVVFG